MTFFRWGKQEMETGNLYVLQGQALGPLLVGSVSGLVEVGLG